MEIYWIEQTESDVPSDNQWLSPEEAICLLTMRFAKRRTDWRLGRWTAKHALAACLNLPTDLHTLAKVEIYAASSGAPDAFIESRPANLAISLSHCSGKALCTVGPRAANFGCDLEKIEPRSNAFIADYFTATEQALIGHASSQERPLLLAVLWSAKSSALKALRVGLRLDTSSVCVSPGDEWSHAAEEWQPGMAPSNSDVWHPMSVRYAGTQPFDGWWRTDNDLVRTVVCDFPLRPPRHATSSTFSSEAELTPTSRTSLVPL